MNIDILHRPTALENLLAGRIWPAGRRLPMHAIHVQKTKKKLVTLDVTWIDAITFGCVCYVLHCLFR